MIMISKFKANSTMISIRWPSRKGWSKKFRAVRLVSSTGLNNYIHAQQIYHREPYGMLVYLILLKITNIGNLVFLNTCARPFEADTEAVWIHPKEIFNLFSQFFEPCFPVTLLMKPAIARN